MGMNRDDVLLKNGERAPANAATRRKGDAWNDFRRRFEHKKLSQALAGFGVAKVRTR